MGCMPVRVKQGTVLPTTSTVFKLNDLRITEGMLVQESKGNPFDFYDQVESLGEGSFGKVIKVRHKISKVLRALKVIQKDKAKINEDDEKELINEINVVKALDHPNIMKVYEFYNTEKCLYIVSELCTGGELFDMITANGHFNEKLSGYVMKQLLSAVDFCHQNGIIHRDLKPENILIESHEEKRKEYFTIKLIDFGTSGKMTKGKMFKQQIGTPFYIAPEVLQNKYNEKCDMWSCGVILYIMLCGVPPFYGETDEEIYAAVKRGIPDFAEPEWDSISEESKDLINKLLVKNITKRYSAKEALMHVWISKMKLGNQLSPKNLNQIIDNIKRFSVTRKLQQATLAFIVHNLTSKEDIEQSRACFIQFDENGDGRLTKEEMIKGVNLVLSIEEATKEVERIMSIIDVDGNGFIEYEEFLRASLDKKRILTTENVRTVFRIFDKNDSGKITPVELKQVLGQSGENIEENVWKEIINEINLNGDGEICFNDFDKMMDVVRDTHCPIDK